MRKPTAIDNEITRTEILISQTPVDSKEYYRLLNHLKQLRDLKDQERKFRFEVSGDTLVVAGVNILGILLILKHEHLNVISTKALGFITKLKF